MNIFYLNDCPRRAAEEQCDQHIVKMPEYWYALAIIVFFSIGFMIGDYIK